MSNFAQAAAEIKRLFFHPNNVVCFYYSLPLGICGFAPAMKVVAKSPQHRAIYIHSPQIGCPRS